MNNTFHSAGANILIVDDVRANLRLLAGILAEQGYVVRPVLDGIQALSAIAAETPDLILMDIKMPRLSGYEVCVKLKSDPATCDIPVIFISALSDVEDKVRAFSAGGVDFITKPFQGEEVLARVQTHLKLKRLQMALQEKNLQLGQEMAGHQRTARALSRSEARFREIFFSHSAPMLLVNPDTGRITDANRAATVFYGYTLEEFRALRPGKISPVLPEKILTETEPAQTGQRNYFVYPHRMKNGEIRTVETYVSPVEVGDERLLFAIVHDITDRRKAERKLRQYAGKLEVAKREAESANWAKSEFLANMSHEIRTPLNAILGFAEILEGEITDPRRKEYLKSIRSGGKSLLVLINDILDLSKVEAGKLELQYTAFDPLPLFEEVGRIFSRKMAQKGLAFRLDAHPNLTRTVFLDEARLRQVLLNLIGNAIKFTHEGHIRLAVRSTPAEGKPEAVRLSFSVEDTGIGIPDDQKKTIFGPFEQQQGQRHAEYGGTGLGLAISGRLVEMMGGTISVADKKGRGSVFHVNFDAVEIPAQSPVSPENDRRADADFPKFEPATLLIADDMKINRKVIRGYLGHCDFRFLEASDGREAFEMAVKYLPDIIFMDMKMPVLDGHDAMRQIKETPSVRHIPVIAVTALAMKDFRDRILPICDGYLARPFSRAALIAELKRFLKYSVAVSPETPADAPEMFSPEVLARLPDLIRLLEGGLKKNWEELCDILIINEIERFAGVMKELGEEFHYTPLAKWGEQMLRQALLFDTEALSRTLGRYPEIIRTLKVRSGPEPG
ncbi:hybrid sensor histidine kinase/response regulato r [Desulfonema ishimotonii]|uniref:histidine kinase n=1 Tax=Desulfonema ishimotonii TaxID=45657 RepID=A0A401FRJ7_9BACT|nr:response regulator [Desulfonema ishimotonii]GBC59586.1 hybrid sensor histidine kinase/response regulato r [Desulfonema ishimotonii]